MRVCGVWGKLALTSSANFQHLCLEARHCIGRLLHAFKRNICTRKQRWKSDCERKVCCVRPIRNVEVCSAGLNALGCGGTYGVVGIYYYYIVAKRVIMGSAYGGTRARYQVLTQPLFPPTLLQKVIAANKAGCVTALTNLAEADMRRKLRPNAAGRRFKT
jgi:hypothetical protein